MGGRPTRGALTEVETPSGRMRTHVSVGPASAPVVVLLMDVWGLREELFTIADAVSAAGYTCFVPDFYYRQGIVSHAVFDEDGRMRTLADLSSAQQEQIRASLRQLRDDDVVQDARCLLNYARDQRLMTHQRAGSVGYCMGGRHAMRLAAAFPDVFVAGASLHGSDLVTDQPGSAHLQIPQMRGSFYCGFAELDPYAAPAVQAALARSFDASPVAYRSKLHRAARHGYALPLRDVHDPRATSEDWEAIFDMLGRELKSR